MRESAVWRLGSVSRGDWRALPIGCSGRESAVVCFGGGSGGARRALPQRELMKRESSMYIKKRPPSRNGSAWVGMAIKKRKKYKKKKKVTNDVDISVKHLYI